MLWNFLQLPFDNNMSSNWGNLDSQQSIHNIYCSNLKNPKSKNGVCRSNFKDYHPNYPFWGGLGFSVNPKPIKCVAHPNFWQKIPVFSKMSCQILTYTKEFSWENMTQICQISKKQKIQIAGFLWKGLVGSQEHDKFYFHI